MRGRIRVSAAVVALTVVSLVLPSRAAARVPANFYGVGVLVPEVSRGEFQTMHQGGVRSFRNILGWPAIEPQPGQFKWAAEDETIRYASEAGIQVVNDLVQAPGWVTGCAGSNCGLRSRSQLRRWREFVVRAVRRYGAGGQFWKENPDVPYRPVRFWQIWNEQNGPLYWMPRPSAKQYTELLRVTSRAIKHQDRRARIVLGGMFGTPGEPPQPRLYSWRFLRGLYKRGAKPYFDAVAIHPYSPDLNGIIEQVRRVRAVMKAHGDRKTAMWFTELGWESNISNHYLSKGVAGQADILRQSFSLILRKRRAWRVTRLFWFCWRDSGGNEPFAHSGLVNEDLTPKPSWTAYQEFARR
jgi:polysaccharide biosynthesis protein PslG